ncbi:hypothetical protein ACF044_05070 [Microbacterium sp. NPDC016588]
MIRYSPKTGEPFELLREFTGRSGIVAVIRQVDGGLIYNVAKSAFLAWAEADA